tara:strand:+ start:3778 stop:5481 length:1704 start_codon:yes stop_codon:yes gene_type:complete
MALKFDGNGYVSFPAWNSGIGDFRIEGTYKHPATSSFQAIIGSTEGSLRIFYTDTGGTLKLKVSSTATLTGFTADVSYPVIIERVGSSITITANGQSQSFGYAGTNVPWDLFGGFGASASSRFLGSMEGIWTFTDDTGGIRTYDFNQPIGSTVLPDTTGGFDGTLTGFTTGGFDGSGSDSIVITSTSDGSFFNRDNLQNESVITIAGDNVGAVPTSVECRIDYGDWFTLDAAPTATFSGDVTIKNKQFLQVRGVGVDTVSPVLTLTVGLSIVAGWQSNEQGYGINTQPVNKGASSPTPLMYNGTDIVALVDPVATVAGFGGSGGSTWPRIARHYSENGTAICLYNIAKGGSLISEWQKGGVNYDKIQTFADLVGGVGLFTCIGGENDAQNGITQASMETQLTQLVTDINTDFGCDSYICKFPMKAPSGNVATVFAAYDAVISANSFAKHGGDLSVIDIEIATADGNDGVHLKQDAALTTAADIRYSAQQAGLIENSTLNISVTGIPAGDYETVFSANGVEVYRGLTTYGEGSLSLVLPVPVGVTVKGFVDDDLNPSSNGAYLEGVTE